ncbi:MAG: glycosyltransferase N-terminal domain-containing protein [Myxococcota bacterium]
MRVFAHSGAALLALGAAPAGVLALALRPGLRAGLGERLGGVPRTEPGAIWVHGASVGEAAASLALHELLLAQGHRTVASTTTPTGQELLARRRPELTRMLAPLDHPWCVGAALARVQPRALVLVETELWPSWIAAAERRAIPVVLVSARLSDRSFPRYRRLAFAVTPTLGRLARIGARTRLDAERFLALGVPPERVEVTGDLKLEAPAEPPCLAPDLAEQLGPSRWLVAGSTHASEEGAALAALAAAEAAGHALGLVLAPRHPERAPDVLREVAAAGRRGQLRSQLSGPLAAGEVLVLDTLGELPALYARASVVFVGGSLVPRGGHNVLEPVRVGRPVLFGTHTENARQSVDLLLGCGAGRRLADSAALTRAVLDELADPDGASRRGEAGRALLEAHRGAARRSVELVERVLAPPVSR